MKYHFKSFLGRAALAAVVFMSAGSAFAKSWTYDSTAKTYSDGEWCLSISTATPLLKVKVTAYSGTSWKLDLTGLQAAINTYGSTSDQAAYAFYLDGKTAALNDAGETLKSSLKEIDLSDLTQITDISYQGQNSGKNGLGQLDVLERVVLPRTIRTLGAGAFYQCSKLKTIDGVENVTTFYLSCFAATGLERVSLPNAEKFSGDTNGNTPGQFKDCTSLQDLSIGDGTKDIVFSDWSLGGSGNRSPIQNCSALTNVTIKAKKLSLGNSTFGLVSGLKKVTITAEELSHLGQHLFRVGNGSSSALEKVVWNCPAPEETVSGTSIFAGTAATMVNCVKNDAGWENLDGTLGGGDLVTDLGSENGMWKNNGMARPIAYLTADDIDEGGGEDEPVDPPDEPSDPPDVESDPVATNNLTVTLYAPFEPDGEATFYVVRATALAETATLGDEQRPEIVSMARVTLEGRGEFWAIEVGNLWRGVAYSLRTAASVETAPEDFIPVTNNSEVAEGTVDVNPTYIEIHSSGELTVTDNSQAEKGGGGPVYSEIVFRLTDSQCAYDRQPHTVGVSVNPSDATLTWATAADGTYTATQPTRTDAGETIVFAKANRPGYAEASASARIVVEQAENAWTEKPALSKTSWTIGEPPATVSKAGAAKFGDVTNDYDPAAITAAGTYTATFAVAETANWKGLSLGVDFTVLAAARFFDVGVAVFNAADPQKMIGTNGQSVAEGATYTWDFSDLVPPGRQLKSWKLVYVASGGEGGEVVPQNFTVSVAAVDADNPAVTLASDVKAVAEGETYTWDLTQLIPPGQEIVSWELEP